MSQNDPDRDEGKSASQPGQDFLRAMVAKDKAEGRFDSRVHTRFPPEPNGYLHIGHAKSICLNFGLAAEFGGSCNLRFDDTNPVKEDVEYVDAIKEDVRWLGFDWEGEPHFASDYFGALYAFALLFIKAGLAYVDKLSADEIREYRGTLTRPGIPGPWRDRPLAESLDLFRRMKDGEFADGEYVLRAKIDMASPNVIMRDPTLYRIRHAHHHRTGDRWVVYPMYDFTHCISDFLEGITHSLCTLEFVNNRELYDWTLDNLMRLLAQDGNLARLEAYRTARAGNPDAPLPEFSCTPGALPDQELLRKLAGNRPRQTEFARLSLTDTVLSKRKLIQLVREGYVSGWDDPRMPTISGLRRRGCTPEAVRELIDRIGVARVADSVVDYGLLEFCVREHLNAATPRCMAVQDPIRLIIEDYPADREEVFELPLHPEDDSYGKRAVPFCRELYIERDDFREDPPKKYHRLAPGAEVRLRYAYYVTCREVVRDAEGRIVELRCTHDPASRGGSSPDGRKVRGTIHWVSARHALPVEVRLYSQLFLRESPQALPPGEESGDEPAFTDLINPDSLKVITAQAEPYLWSLTAGTRVQFERLGYYCVDKDSDPARQVFNRTVTLKDSWAKLEKRL